MSTNNVKEVLANANKCPNVSAVLFSECGFKGRRFEINYLTSQIDIDWKVKSIKVPKDFAIDLFKDEGFSG